jgi:hypothetical protein
MAMVDVQTAQTARTSEGIVHGWKKRRYGFVLRKITILIAIRNDMGDHQPYIDGFGRSDP